MNSPLRIVLVDDDVNVLFLLERTLKGAFTGWDFYAFETAHLALPYILHHPVDLLVTDNQMPGMDGSELVRELRTQGWGRPIIMISGSPDAEQKGIAAGITRFITKGSSAMGEELITIILELLPVEAESGTENLIPPRQETQPKPKQL